MKNLKNVVRFLPEFLPFILKIFFFRSQKRHEWDTYVCKIKISCKIIYKIDFLFKMHVLN